MLDDPGDRYANCLSGSWELAASMLMHPVATAATIADRVHEPLDVYWLHLWAALLCFIDPVIAHSGFAVNNASQLLVGNARLGRAQHCGSQMSGNQVGFPNRIWHLHQEQISNDFGGLKNWKAQETLRNSGMCFSCNAGRALCVIIPWPL